MSEQRTLEEEVSRGADAKRIIEAPLFADAVARVQQSIFDAFAATDPKDAAALSEQRLRLKCLADIVRDLKTVMQTGQLAAAQKEHEQTLAARVAERVKRGIRAVF